MSRTATRVAGLILILGIAGITRLHAQCACEDRDSMKDRIAEAQAAIAAYRQYIGAFPTPDALTSRLDYKNMQQFVQGKLDVYRTAHPAFTSYASETNSACEIRLKGDPPACLADALTAHERVHQASCKAKMRTSDFLTGTLYYVEKMTLRQVAQEEITGYTAEITLLTQRLAGLAGTCDLVWQGTVTYTYQYDHTTTTPVTNGTETQTVKNNDTIVFTITPQGVSANHSYSSVTTNKTEVANQDRCRGTGSETVIKPFRYVETSVMSTTGQATAPGTGGLEFADGAPTGTLIVGAPELPLKMLITGDEQSTGGCQAKEPVHRQLASDDTAAAFSQRVKVSRDPKDPRRLSGSEITPPADPASGGTTTIKWDLTLKPR